MMADDKKNATKSDYPQHPEPSGEAFLSESAVSDLICG
jgi:hypothetical protein